MVQLSPTLSWCVKCKCKGQIYYPLSHVYATLCFVIFPQLYASLIMRRKVLCASLRNFTLAINLCKDPISCCDNTNDHCFFCEQPGNQSNLHQAETLKVDKKVRDCAVLLNDGKLIAKLSVGDMVALEAKYHTSCLVSLYNRARNQRSASLKESNTTMSDLEV